MNGDVLFVHATRCVAARCIPQRTFAMHATVCCCVLLRVALSIHGNALKEKITGNSKVQQKQQIIEFGRNSK